MAKEQKCGIYCITNTVNGKQYIGQSISIYERWYQHKWATKNDYDNSHLHRAMRKYGIDNFKFEIICECPKEELDKKQIYYIKQYGTYGDSNGYNETPGGNFYGYKDYESIDWENEEYFERYGRKVYQYGLNCSFIKEYRSILSASRENNITPGGIQRCLKGECSSWGGYIWIDENGDRSPDTIKRLADNAKKGHSVTQFTTKGEFISEYQTITEASYKTGVPEGAIRASASGVTNTGWNYIWLYSEDVDTGLNTRLEKMKEKPSHKVKRTAQFTLDGNLIKIYKSMNAASVETGIYIKGIQRCVNGKNNYAGGFLWFDADRDDLEEAVKEKVEYLKQNGILLAQNPVVQYTKDMKYIGEFKNIAEAARKTGIYDECISDCLIGKQHTTGGYIFRYKGQKTDDYRKG